MGTVRVVLPAVLTVALRREHVDVEAATLAEALALAYAACPGLEPAVCDESGGFREHVLCLLETAQGTLNSRWLPNLERALVPGERIVFMQAVSGG